MVWSGSIPWTWTWTWGLGRSSSGSDWGSESFPSLFEKCCHGLAMKTANRRSQPNLILQGTHWGDSPFLGHWERCCIWVDCMMMACQAWLEVNLFEERHLHGWSCSVKKKVSYSQKKRIIVKKSQGKVKKSQKNWLFLDSWLKSIFFDCNWLSFYRASIMAAFTTSSSSAGCHSWRRISCTAMSFARKYFSMWMLQREGSMRTWTRSHQRSHLHSMCGPLHLATLISHSWFIT